MLLVFAMVVVKVDVVNGKPCLVDCIDNSLRPCIHSFGVPVPGIVDFVEYLDTGILGHRDGVVLVNVLHASFIKKKRENVGAVMKLAYIARHIFRVDAGFLRRDNVYKRNIARCAIGIHFGDEVGVLNDEVVVVVVLLEFEKHVAIVPVLVHGMFHDVEKSIV